MSEMNGLVLFAWVSVFMLISVVVIFAILFWIFAKAHARTPLDIPDKVQALASVLTLFFGTAAAIGGAIAAIQVASLGLEIAHRQEQRDSTQFIETKVTRSIDLYSNLLIALSEAYALAVFLDVNTSHITKQHIIDQMKQDTPIEVSIAMKAFAESLWALNHVIRQLIRDEFTHYCFTRSVEELESKLDHLNKKLLSLGTEESMLTLSVTDLSDITAILDVAARRVQMDTVGNLIKAQLLTNPDIEQFGMPYNNRNVRSFMFAGNLIFSMNDYEQKNQVNYIASYGAAIFHDLLYAVPDGERITDCITDRYQEIAKQAGEQNISFNPHNISSDTLKSAVKDVESIGDLYLLIGGPTHQREH